MGTASESTVPPDPSGLSIVGCALDSRRSLEFLLENRRDYGDIWREQRQRIQPVLHPDQITV